MTNQERLAEIDGYYWAEYVFSDFGPSADRMMRKAPEMRKRWRVASMSLPLNEDPYGELPNYDTDGEMMRMLRKWKDAVPGGTRREYTTHSAGEHTVFLLIYVDGMLNAQEVFLGSAPTFIEAAQEALIKAHEK